MIDERPHPAHAMPGLESASQLTRKISAAVRHRSRPASRVAAHAPDDDFIRGVPLRLHASA
ncbi:hypothetical protein WS71_26380 [Burkholderia mayonis]|uniref:Uncharacterized protein n=1 Tax=Burkholderia mayonis TaxID=1385591 RepID=A0A1B4G459_9BURK|nr:hypothetical protein WS71_26380 [Burkholderia mayonis]KVE53120.1 hypothetical protein WS71_07565 [Burkholderia mayonis]